MSSLSGRLRGRVSSLEDFAKFCETARDAAGDRAGRDLEDLADRLVALVAGEKAVEDLLEDVLRVVGAQAEPLRRNGIDVAREAVDELLPGALVAGAATGDQRRVGK